MTMEKSFFDSAKQGVTMSMLFAFFMMLLATCSFIVSLIAILCIASIIITELAMMEMLGWQLGVTESVAVVILVGLSVDYTVHLAAEFVHSKRNKRMEKMQQAYAAMGVSIFSAFVTTAGAGCFLLGGKLAIFRKFGICLVSTIVVSFFVSMWFFGAFMHALGPEEGCCDLTGIKKILGYGAQPEDHTIVVEEQEVKAENEEGPAPSAPAEIELASAEPVA